MDQLIMRPLRTSEAAGTNLRYRNPRPQRKRKGMTMRNLLRSASIVLSTGILATGLAAASAASAATGSAAQPAIPQARSALCNYTGAQPQLSEGSTGTAVKQAQCELNWAYAIAHGDTLAVDGDFGPLTRAVTRAFQSCVHIAVDGIIGPDTWAELNYWVNQPTFACT
jgi:peptidoglycan hydrolase-like protein with peptidoglycan-binding domain